MPDVVVAVLMTLDSKEEETRFVCEALSRARVQPWLMDLSLCPHDLEGASVSGGRLAEAAGSSWASLAEMDRRRASEEMISGGRKILLEKFRAGGISGVIGVGGANGASMACSLMRSLPPLFPKVMVSPVAATAAVQWYVAESDIAMFPSIGDLSINRITRAVMENAAWSVASMAREWAAKKRSARKDLPLVGVSSFGGTAGCVDRVSETLIATGYEVIHLHASGPGGRALESLAGLGELAGVIDVTTHELTDLVVGGVYSAGDGRLRAAGEAGLPQVVVPGALDHANFWVGMVPNRFRDREFFQYNAQILLMRTNAEELETLGRLVAERMNDARGPFAVLIPRRGFSEHTKRKTHDLEGGEVGPWAQPEVDRAFGESLRTHLKKGRVEELDLHINDAEFADACVEAFFEMMKKNG
ncbi:Tm-1-like ATP-binding domain-containing protein [Nitrospinota bacterium]